MLDKPDDECMMNFGSLNLPASLSGSRLSRGKILIIIGVLFGIIIATFHSSDSISKIVSNQNGTQQASQTATPKTTYESVDDYDIDQVFPRDSIRYKLAKAFPYKKSTEKPSKNIFQMWKNNDISTLDEGIQKLIATWQTQTAEDKGGFAYSFIGDSELESIVEKAFVDVPEVFEAFKLLPKIILKSDFMRYLLIYTQGGIYSDIDTSLNTDILQWISYQDKFFDQENKIGLVIGVESDRDELSWARNGMARRLQYCQWTLHAKKHHPFYRELIARITELALFHFNPETKLLVKNNVEYDFNKDSKTSFAGTMEWTGPGQFTDVLFYYLNNVYLKYPKLFPNIDFLKEKYINPNLEKNLQETIRYEMLEGSWHNEYNPTDFPIGWQNLTKQVDPILFDDDVLILPIIYFNGKHGETNNYVQHHFKGSWKNN